MHLFKIIKFFVVNAVVVNSIFASAVSIEVALLYNINIINNNLIIIRHCLQLPLRIAFDAWGQ